MSAGEEPGVGATFGFVSPLHAEPVVGLTEFSFQVADEGEVERIDVYVQGRLIGTATRPDWSFSWDAPSDLIGTAIVAVAFGRDGLIEKLEISTSAAAFDDLVHVITVQLFPVVTDRKGRYVSDLSKEDFSVYDEGRSVVIETFSAEASDLSLALVIDSSRSMEGKMGIVQEASCQVIDRLRAAEQVAVYSFNHAVMRGQTLGAEPELAKETIRRLVPVGGTALFDALMHVMHDLGSVRGRKAIVLFSDGQDERSITSLDRVVGRARETEVIVYSVGAGGSAHDSVARKDLWLLAEETGGQAHFIDRIGQLPTIFDSILTDLRAQYSLSYTPEPAQAGQRRVEVRTKDPLYEVRCRRTYFHPGTEPGVEARSE